MLTSSVIQFLATVFLSIAAWKDIKDRAVWKGLGNILVLTGVSAILISPSNVPPIAILVGPALGWLAEQFNLWTSFDTRLLISVVMLNAESIPILLLVLWPIYLSWATLWRWKRPSDSIPVAPVFLFLHLALLFL